MVELSSVLAQKHSESKKTGSKAVQCNDPGRHKVSGVDVVAGSGKTVWHTEVATRQQGEWKSRLAVLKLDYFFSIRSQDAGR